jgi:hypothetical protein
VGFIKYASEVVSSDTISILSFLEIGAGVQAMLMFCLSNLIGFNVGITDERDL